jgi:hypothetical protein
MLKVYDQELERMRELRYLRSTVITIEIKQGILMPN